MRTGLANWGGPLWTSTGACSQLLSCLGEIGPGWQSALFGVGGWWRKGREGGLDVRWR